MNRTRLVAAALAVVPTLAFAQGRADAYTFHMITGKDTLSTEVVHRTPDRLEVELAVKPAGIRYRYAIALGPDGRALRMTTDVWTLASTDTAPAQHAIADFTGDSAHLSVVARGGTQTLVLPASPGAVPYINLSTALLEQAVMRAKAMGGRLDSVPMFALAGGRNFVAPVEWIGADSATITLPGVVIRMAVAPDGSVLGAFAPSQNLRAEREGGAHPMGVAPVDYGAPPGAPYVAEDVTVRTPEGLTLTGTLTLPRLRSGRVPAIVTITGSGAQDRDERISIVNGYRPFWQVADTLARRGIATLRLDDRGINGSDAGPASATSADFANDIRAGLAYLRSRPEIDGTHLGLVGHSEGGMIAPMIAATDPSLRGIVLMAGTAQTGRQIMAYQARNAIEHDTALSAAQRDSALAAAARSTDSLAQHNAWVRYFLDYDPLATARKVRVPVLILQGEKDQQVTPEQAGALASAFRAGGNHDVTVRLFPNTDHLFVADSDGFPGRYPSLPSGNVRPAVLGTLADWLVAHLGAGAKGHVTPE